MMPPIIGLASMYAIREVEHTGGEVEAREDTKARQTDWAELGVGGWAGEGGVIWSSWT